MAYIGYFPVSAGFTGLNFKIQTTTKKTVAASGRTIRATNGTSLWQGTLSFPPVSYDDFLPIQAFVARCQGSLNEFDLVIPEISTHNPHPTQVTFVRTDAAAGATSVLVNSDQINKSTLLKAGDVIRFPNHAKVYMVIEDVASDGSGDATIQFQPALVTAVDSDSAGENIIVNAVPFRMILSGDLQEFGYNNQGFVKYEIDVQEVY
tara:strand:- start:3932 stop:4549 length:618 start_codon:yes stop_codon:yes gene_type:complete